MKRCNVLCRKADGSFAGLDQHSVSLHRQCAKQFFNDFMWARDVSVRNKYSYENEEVKV